MNRSLRLITLGRWIVMVTHGWECAILGLSTLLAAYSIITGEASFHLDEPYESVLSYAVFASSAAVIVCWSIFCLVFAVSMRRLGQAGSLKQLMATLRVAIPILGLGYYDRLICELTRPPSQEQPGQPIG